MNTRILQPTSKTQDKEDSQNHWFSRGFSYSIILQSIPYTVSIYTYIYIHIYIYATMCWHGPYVSAVFRAPKCMRPAAAALPTSVQRCPPAGTSWEQLQVLPQGREKGYSGGGVPGSARVPTFNNTRRKPFQVSFDRQG